MVKRTISAFVIIFAVVSSPLAGQDHIVHRQACESKIVPYGEDPPSLESWHLHVAEATGGGALLYFGAVHSREPDHEQVEHIVDRWEEFAPTLAFYEGPDRGHGASITETVRQGGESALVRHLADRDGVELRRLEPPARLEAAYVLERYPVDQVKLFYVLREAARLRDVEALSPPAIEERIATLLERTRTLGELGESITTLSELEEAYAGYWSAPDRWWKAPARWFDPLLASEATGGLFTNDINVRSSHYRNVHMFRILSTAAASGKRVFAVVGRNHVPMQAPALRCVLRPGS